MSTALELITASLKKLGVYQEGETISPDALKDGLFSLKTMLSGWNIQTLAVYGLEIETFPLVAGQSSYTIGPGGNFDTVTPSFTDSLYLKYSDGVEYPIKLVDNKIWGSLQTKDSTSSIPRYAYIDINHPLRKVYLYPTPSEAKNLVFHNYRKLSAITDTSTNLSFPDGYERAIIYNLAIEMAPEYGVEPSGTIFKIATESFENIKRANIRPVTVPIDSAITSRNSSGWDWRKGE